MQLNLISFHCRRHKLYSDRMFSIYLRHCVLQTGSKVNNNTCHRSYKNTCQRSGKNKFNCYSKLVNIQYVFVYVQYKPGE